MKQILPILLLLLLAAGALTGGFMLWQRRPGRVVITVNGRPLTAQEQEERAELRRRYIDSFKASLVSQLETTYIVDEKGNKTKVQRKKH